MKEVHCSTANFQLWTAQKVMGNLDDENLVPNSDSGSGGYIRPSTPFLPFRKDSPTWYHHHHRLCTSTSSTQCYELAHVVSSSRHHILTRHDTLASSMSEGAMATCLIILATRIGSQRLDAGIQCRMPDSKLCCKSHTRQQITCV